MSARTLVRVRSIIYSQFLEEAVLRLGVFPRRHDLYPEGPK